MYTAGRATSKDSSLLRVISPAMLYSHLDDTSVNSSASVFSDNSTISTLFPCFSAYLLVCTTVAQYALMHTERSCTLQKWDRHYDI